MADDVTELSPTHPSVRELLDALRTLAEERPAHRAYLREMEAAAAPLAAAGRYREAVDAVYEVSDETAGVSQRVKDALEDDLAWIILFEEPVRGNRAQYPNAYRERRVTDARAASDRARTRDRNWGLPGGGLIDWSGVRK